MPTSDHLVSDQFFHGFVTVFTLLLATWAFYDIVKWGRLKGQDPSDPLVKDKKAGYLLGIALGIVATVGALMYQGWL